MKTIYSALLFIIIFSLSLSAKAGTIHIEPGESVHKFGKSIDIFPDKSSNKTIQDVLKIEHSQWSASKYPSPNFGFTHSAMWMRFVLQSDKTKSHDVLLEIGYPTLDNVDLYVVRSSIASSSIVSSSVVSSNIVEHWHTGDSTNFFSRPIQHRNFLFPLTINNQSSLTIYIRTKTAGTHKVPISLWHPSTFQEQDQVYLAVDMLYFGIMIIMVIYNLFIYVSLRELNYILYVLMSSSVAFFQGTISGVLYQFVWPNQTWWNNAVGDISVLCVVIFSNIFTYHFLDVRNTIPKIAPIFQSYIAIGTTLLVATISPLSTASHLLISKFIFLLVILTFSTNLLIGLARWRQGSSSGKYYVISFSILFIGSITLALVSGGFLPPTPLTNNLLQFGSTLEVVLLSFALAERIIQERREKLQALKQSQADQLAKSRAEIAIESKSSLLSTLSHEIRNPINGILGMTYILMRNSRNQEQKIQLESMYDSLTSLTNILNNSLLLQKHENSSPISKPCKFDIRRELESIAMPYYLEAKRKSINLRTSISDKIPPKVYLDKVAYRQIVTNLLSNATKFTDYGSVCIFVNLSKAVAENGITRALETIIDDTGSGFSQQQIDNLFTPFHNIEHKDGYQQGIGLGLTICQQLASAQGGSISVTSVKGKGSRVIVSIPLPSEDHQPEISETVSESFPSAPQTMNGLHILVVDDLPINQEVIQYYLEELGHNVVTANNGAEAILLLEESTSNGCPPYDLILMDLYMPVMNGFSTVRAIRKLNHYYRYAPIIAVTASTPFIGSESFSDLGFDRTITKPITHTKLKDTITLVCGTDRIKDSVALTTPASLTPIIHEACIKQHVNHIGVTKSLKLIGQLIHTYQEKQQLLNAALSEGDSDKVRTLAHTIKGTSDTFGLMRLAETISVFLTDTSPHNYPDSATLGNIFQESAAALSQLQAKITEGAARQN